ncbi:MAG: indole-3-glycerol phosphate synthase TrpC [Actinobacteria bacterium]|nr:indole-3-glycerol phosphate synthase TrpC [Actinomycetota bacterium]
MTYLDDLLAGARRRVEEARARESFEALRRRAGEGPLPPDFAGALRRPGVSVIAEVKRASPSRGELAPGLDAVAQARAYRSGGAVAISVLTEPERFKGSLDDLAAVSALGTPTLRKDFVVDRYQIWEARATGAAAVLLIVAALDEETLGDLYVAARNAHLDVLVEVHDEDELAVAVDLGAKIIGINARDLRSFELDRDAFARLRPAVPSGTLVVAESGVGGPDDVRRAAAAGADAVLVGESLIAADDPAAAVAALVAAGADAPGQAGASA